MADRLKDQVALITGASAEDYDELVDTNVRSTFLFTRHAVPVMVRQQSGTVLMISSMAGVYGFAGEEPLA
jgi:NADP-dependent 3-hydroxy acid dehydrogenase YdfG